MIGGAPFLSFAKKFREFLEEKGYLDEHGVPVYREFHRDLNAGMGKFAPSYSQVDAVYRGLRKFDDTTQHFMRKRWGWLPEWRETLMERNAAGITTKSNQAELPGIREQIEMSRFQKSRTKSKTA